MEVKLTELNTEIKLQNKGILLYVYSNDGVLKGKLNITRARLTWAKGKKKIENGIEVGWDDFIDWMESE